MLPKPRYSADMDSSAAKSLAEVQMVPLREAVLCVDCENVSNSTSNFCAACGSRALLSIATALGGPLHTSAAISEIETDPATPARFFVVRRGGRP